MATKKTKPFGTDRWVVTKARYLRMLAPLASTEETRYYLRGVHVEASAAGIVLVATDGHRLGVVHDGGGTARGTWINPVSKHLVAAAAKMEKDAVAMFCGRAAFLVPAADASKVKGPKTVERYATFIERNDPIDGTFPDWRRVIPKKVVQRQRPMTINGQYVADFNKVAKAAGILGEGGGAGFLFFQTGGEPDPLFVRHPLIPEFCGIQMPMRGDKIEPIPDWLRAA